MAAINVTRKGYFAVRVSDYILCIVEIGDFCFPRRNRIPGKGHSLTFQTNINLHMFRDEFVVKKKGFFTSARVLFFLQKTSETKLMTVASGEINTILFIT